MTAETHSPLDTTKRNPVRHVTAAGYVRIDNADPRQTAPGRCDGRKRHAPRPRTLLGMPLTSPLTPQQQWAYRHRHGVRVACAVCLVALIGSAAYNLAEHQTLEGILSILICLSPVSLILTIRSLERTVELRDGPSAGP